MRSISSDFKQSMEEKLRDALKPVTPDPDFVYYLENKLTKSSAVLLENPKDKKAIILIGFGLFTGALLIWFLGKIRS